MILLYDNVLTLHSRVDEDDGDDGGGGDDEGKVYNKILTMFMVMQIMMVLILLYHYVLALHHTRMLGDAMLLTLISTALFFLGTRFRVLLCSLILCFGSLPGCLSMWRADLRSTTAPTVLVQRLAWC